VISYEVCRGKDVYCHRYWQESEQGERHLLLQFHSFHGMDWQFYFPPGQDFMHEVAYEYETMFE